MLLSIIGQRSRSLTCTSVTNEGLKKRVILLVIPVALFIVISACSGDEAPPTTAPSSTPTSPAPSSTLESPAAPTPAATPTTTPAVSLPAPDLRADEWVQVNGPYGGYITDLERADDGLWAATSFTYRLGSNGVFRISDDGSKWEARGGSEAAIVDIAVSPSNADRVVFIDTDRGLYVTETGGEDWQRVDLDVGQFTAVVMSAANSSLIFAATATGEESLIFASRDSGKTWTPLSPLPRTGWSVEPIWPGFSSNTINVIEPHPTEEGTLFAGTNSALFKSDDAGQTWSRADAEFHRSDVKDITINPQAPNEVYVRVGVFEEEICGGIFASRDTELEREKCAGVYWSPDLGDSWQQLDAFYADPGEGGIFVDQHDPRTAYAVFARLIFKTEDGGRTWEQFFWTHEEPFIPNVGVERLVVGENSSELFIAGRQGLWRSDDGGTHWQESNVGFIGTEVVDIAKVSDGTLYAGTYSLGMFKSTDGGANWTFASYELENPYVMAIATDPTDPQEVFLTTNGGVYASHDGAASWELVATGFFSESSGLLPGVSHYHSIAIDPTNPRRIYVGGGGDQYTPAGAGMAISEDGGKTWKQSNAGFQTDVHVSKVVINPNDPAIVYVTTQGPTEFQDKTGPGHGVFKSNDYGETWERINVGLGTLEINTIALDSTDPDILYLGTDDDGIYKSSDGGDSWIRILIPQLSGTFGVGDIAVDPRESNVIYVATVDYFRLSGARGLVGDHGIFVSRDGGATWDDFSEGLRHLGVFALELDPEEGILYAGTRGGGIYWRDVNRPR